MSQYQAKEARNRQALNRLKTPKSISKLKKQLDKLFGEYIKNRDGWQCCWCHKPVKGQNAHPSHVIPKSISNHLRYDPQNVKCLCFHCHIQKWHLNPLEAEAWFKETFPERWEYLNKEKNILKSWKRWELEELIEYYKKEVEG